MDVERGVTGRVGVMRHVCVGLGSSRVAKSTGGQYLVWFGSQDEETQIDFLARLKTEQTHARELGRFIT